MQGASGNSGDALSPAAKAKNVTVNGAVLLLIGVIGIGLSLLGVAAMAHADFPGDRVVGLLVLFLLVLTAVVAVRGLVWLVQGLVRLARTPK